MANIILKCKSCGSKISINTFENNACCEYCGNPYDIPQNETRDEILNLYSRADNAWEHKDFDEALEIYEQIIKEDDHQAQAHFASALCKYGISYEIDPGNGRKVPTCNRFNRTSILEDKNYQIALKYSSEENRKSFKKTGEAIERITKDFLSLVNKESPYDVFISYKEKGENDLPTEESIYARKLYYYLTDKGFKVFYAKITLDQIAGEKYEPYIFAALTSAPVMILMGSSTKNIESTWVKNEWKRFLNLKSQGENKTLISCYLKMKPDDFPIEIRNDQALNIGSYTFLEDVTAIVTKKIQHSKTEIKESTGNTLTDKYAQKKKVQILIDKLDCEPKHAAEVLVVFQGNIEDSVEYIQKEEDYRKYLWVCAECGAYNTHDVCHNSACGLTKSDSVALKFKRDEARRNSEREKQKKARLLKSSSIAVIELDDDMSTEDKIACTNILLKKKRNFVWPIMLTASFIVFAISVFLGITVLSEATYSEGVNKFVESALNLLDINSRADIGIIYNFMYISGFVAMFMTAIYFLLASSTKGSFWAEILAVGIANVIAYFLILIIINNPIDVILTFIGNILTMIIGESEDVFKEGTGIVSFVILVFLNYIVSAVNIIRLMKLTKALRSKLVLLKGDYTYKDSFQSNVTGNTESKTDINIEKREIKSFYNEVLNQTGKTNITIEDLLRLRKRNEEDKQEISALNREIEIWEKEVEYLKNKYDLSQK